MVHIIKEIFSIHPKFIEIHFKFAVPLVVAINKIDAPGANIVSILETMSESIELTHIFLGRNKKWFIKNGSKFGRSWW